MFRTILFFVFVALFYSGTLAQNPSIAPKLVSTVPAFADCEVDSGFTAIIFTFNQDMSGGYTIGNSPDLPEITGKLSWVDAKTLSVPVRLYPNKRYSLVLNNVSSSKGFANTSGILLNPEALLFRTKPYGQNTPNQDAALNKKAYQEFRNFFPKEYSYASLKGIDWNDVLERSRNELENARSAPVFALKLVKLLRLAQDPHLTVVADGETLATKLRDVVEYNYYYQAVLNRLKEVKVGGGSLNFAGVVDNVGYISIGSWATDLNTLQYKAPRDTTSSASSFDEVLTELTKFPNIIVDVRANTGGNDIFARDFASRFIKEPKPYEKVMSFNEQTGLFDKELYHVLNPSAKQINYSGNIYVLSGPSVFSSNESFILMMKQVPNAKVVGMTTYGSSGNPIPHTLSNGVTINLPSWQAYTLDGRLIEGNGVEPDMEIKTTKADFLTNDALFESVLNMINKKE